MPGPALTSAALYSCSPRLRMESPSCHAGARLEPDIARRARRGRLRRCQASDDEGRGQTLSFQSGCVWRHGCGRALRHGTDLSPLSHPVELGMDCQEIGAL